MLKSIQMLLVGMTLLAPMAFGQLGSLDDFDGVLQAKFALKISELDQIDSEDVPPSFTLTSGSLIREYKLPGSTRVYWVFRYNGPDILSGLVLADSTTGDIYSVIAHAQQVSDDFVEEDAGVDIPLLGDQGMEEWLTATYQLNFDLEGLQLSMQALMKFQFVEQGNVSLLRMSSIAGPVGDGTFDDQTRLIITGSSISASGIIANQE